MTTTYYYIYYYTYENVYNNNRVYLLELDNTLKFISLQDKIKGVDQNGKIVAKM